MPDLERFMNNAKGFGIYAGGPGDSDYLLVCFPAEFKEQTIGIIMFVSSRCLSLSFFPLHLLVSILTPS